MVMLNERWQEILKDQILGDEETKKRFVTTLGYQRNIGSMEGCKLAEGAVIEVWSKTSVLDELKIKRGNKARLKLIKKYPHFGQFELLGGMAPNNYICFSYVEIEALRNGSLVPEFY